jgi:diadenosine tetraphosphate (Ap4A) HIT family hydrolase
MKIYDYASAYMTIAKAPYSEDHILVIPKRCVESIFNLTIEEHDEIQ